MADQHTTLFDASLDWDKDARDRSVADRAALILTHRGETRALDRCAFEIDITLGSGAPHLAPHYGAAEAIRCSFGAEHDIHIARRRDRGRNAFVWYVRSNSSALIKDGDKLAILFADLPPSAAGAHFKVSAFLDGKRGDHRILTLPVPARAVSQPRLEPGLTRSEPLKAGWNQVSCRHAGHEYEPTVLFDTNGDVINGDVIYGLFRDEQRDKARLLRSAYPFREWTLVKGGELPVEAQAMHTSPGIYFKGRLWLIGGSQVGAAKSANTQVWYFDLSEQVWKQFAAEGGFTERMGQSVLVFRDQIWVMGGFDGALNPLNDVWILDIANAKWTLRVETAAWTGRGRSAVCCVDDAIYLYGGMEGPDTDKFIGEAWLYRDNGWIKIDNFTADPAPMAACLQRVKDRLYLLGVENKQEKVRSFFCATDAGSPSCWESLPCDALDAWEKQPAPAYRLLGWKDRCVVAIAPNPRKPNRHIQIYQFK